MFTHYMLHAATQYTCMNAMTSAINTSGTMQAAWLSRHHAGSKVALCVQAGRESIKAALQGVDRSQVAAMGVSGQQHGLVALDANKTVIRPAKLWCDTEAALQAECLSQQQGWKMPPGCAPPHMHLDHCHVAWQAQCTATSASYRSRVKLYPMDR